MTLEVLAHLTPGGLTDRLCALRRDERALLVDLLWHIAEVDRRRLYLEMAYPSLFAFATDFLGYTKAAAFRRTTAARLLARFPVIAEHLADGRLNLTTLVELRDVLDEARLEEVLSRAAGRTEEQVKELVAALAPRPAPDDLLRRLPANTGSGPEPVFAPVSSGPELQRPTPAPRIEPISENLRVLRVTVDAAFTADLAAVRSALSHKIPDGNLVAVLRECVRVTLAAATKRRRGAGRPSRSASSATGRYIPAAIRDAVWRRDDGCCAFVAADGRRCGSTHQLELHHLIPFARRGEASVDNLALRCKAHNLHEARRDFGDERIDRAMA